MPAAICHAKGHVKSECEKLRRGQEQARGRKPVALVKTRNCMFHAGNMDRHRVVTQVESARLTGTKCGPAVLDISSCTGDHCRASAFPFQKRTFPFHHE